MGGASPAGRRKLTKSIKLSANRARAAKAAAAKELRARERKGTVMENRFDELAKALAGGVSRREVMRRLGLWVAGGTVAALGLATKAAAEVGTVAHPGPCHHLCNSGCPKGAASRADCTDQCQ